MGPVLRHDDREVRYLHREQVERLFSAIDNERDLVLFGAIYFYGLRVSEAVNLTVGAVDLEHRQVSIKGLKHGLKGVYTIRRDLWKPLKHWIENERADAAAGDPLFTTRQGDGLTRFRAHQLFKSYAAKTGLRLPAGGSVHMLRHSAAVHALDAGLGADDVRDLLRHRSISSTAVYARTSTERRGGYLRHLEQSPAVAGFGTKRGK